LIEESFLSLVSSITFLVCSPTHQPASISSSSTTRARFRYRLNEKPLSRRTTLLILLFFLFLLQLVCSTIRSSSLDEDPNDDVDVDGLSIVYLLNLSLPDQQNWSLVSGSLLYPNRLFSQRASRNRGQGRNYIYSTFMLTKIPYVGDRTRSLHLRLVFQNMLWRKTAQLTPSHRSAAFTDRSYHFPSIEQTLRNPTVLSPGSLIREIGEFGWCWVGRSRRRVVPTESERTTRKKEEGRYSKNVVRREGLVGTRELVWFDLIWWCSSSPSPGETSSTYTHQIAVWVATS